jgi:hypothetical protein
VPDDESTVAWWPPPSDPVSPAVPARPPGLHRADGLAGPPRHYLAVVVLLMGTASLPLVTAIVTVPNSGDTAIAGVSPFLAPPSGGPIVLPSGSTPGEQSPTAAPGDPLLRNDVRSGLRGSSAADPPSTAREPWTSLSPSPRPLRIGSAQPDAYRQPGSTRLPEASPSPVPSPTSTAASTPTPTPASTPTLDPSGTPVPTGTPRPSGTPDPPGTPSRRGTPVPRGTPRPSGTPDPSATSQPSPLPTREPPEV